jgi:predicted GH43/DUF377 family glycosyl hydrolase
MRFAAPLLVCLLSGCVRYDDFALPSPGTPQPGAWRWNVRPEPVLGRGPGPWDAVDALNPSVIEHAGRLLNLYSGFDGRTWHTLLAESADGLQWTKRGRVISPASGAWEGGYIAANGSALVRGGEILYWYQAGSPPRIGLARSSDGRHWAKEPAPVLDLGPPGAWDERAVADPYVITAADRLYLIYLGEDRARRQRLGIAVSGDGLRWTKLRANPVLELGPDGDFDENGLGEPALWSAQGSWWMLYTGRDRSEVRRVGLARSRDGIGWERTGLVLAGQAGWNAKVLCDTTVSVAGPEIRVWFGGGDVAHPVENIHGQIGYGELRWVPR